MLNHQVLCHKIGNVMKENFENNKCAICGEISEGHIVCRNCYNRSYILKDELPANRIKTHDLIMQYRNDLMYKALLSENKYEQETAKIKLIAIGDILKNKYLVQKGIKEILTFMSDIQEGNLTNDEIISKYSISEPLYEPTPEEEAATLEDYQDEAAEKESEETKEKTEENTVTEDRSPFEKGCGTTMGIGCGIFAVIAIVILIISVTTGGTLWAIFS